MKAFKLLISQLQNHQHW